MLKRSTFLAWTALLCGAVPVAAQTVQRVRVRGPIASVNENALTVTTTDGAVRIALAPNAQVRTATKLALSDIKEGMFLGTTAVPQPDGKLRALEVHVFAPPLAASKPGEGFRPNDRAPNATMTNATVTSLAAGSVAGIANRVMTLTYNGGEKAVVVAPTTPIVLFAPATKADLTVGAHVSLLADRNGDGLSTTSVVVGKNGVEPL